LTASLRGIVINVHAHGATVRLEDGGLAAVSSPELAARRALYTRSHERRESLEFEIASVDGRRHRTVRAAGAGNGTCDEAPATAETVAPAGERIALVNDAFEERMADYLRSTQEWAPPDRPQPFERHFLRKKRRAAYFNGSDP
jgi:hypothetical protein